MVTSWHPKPCPPPSLPLTRHDRREFILCANIQEFEAFKRVILARREALGKSARINLIESV